MCSSSTSTTAEQTNRLLRERVPGWTVSIMLKATLAVLCIFSVPMGGVFHLAIDNNVVLFFLLIISALSIAGELGGIARNGSRRSPFCLGSQIILLFFNYNQLGNRATPMGISSALRLRATPARWSCPPAFPAP